MKNRSEPLRRGLLVGAVALQLMCNQAIVTAPIGATMTLVINPEFIPAHGGSAVVSALLIEEAGTPVPDGTVVQFFTTLGDIDEQGKTNDGVARVNLVSDSRSGQARVTAVSGPANATADLTIGAILPSFMVLVAEPNVIDGRGCSRIIANVFDTNGNPVVNVPVIFSFNPPPTPGPSPTPLPSPSPSPSPNPSPSPSASPEPSPSPSMPARGAGSSAPSDGSKLVDLVSGGRPIFTDTNGRAIDELCTDGDEAGQSVTVFATTSNGVSESVEVELR